MAMGLGRARGARLRRTHRDRSGTAEGRIPASVRASLPLRCLTATVSAVRFCLRFYGGVLIALRDSAHLASHQRSKCQVSARFESLDHKMSYQFVWLVGIQVTTLAAASLLGAWLNNVLAAVVGRIELEVS